MYQLYPAALDADLLPDTFWNLSIQEVNDILQSRARVRERQMKERITVANYEVLDLSYRIAAMLSKDAPEERHLWDYFPEFFSKEKAVYEKNQEQNELENFKAGRRRFAAEHNRRWREKHGSAE